MVILARWRHYNRYIAKTVSNHGAHVLHVRHDLHHVLHVLHDRVRHDHVLHRDHHDRDPRHARRDRDLRRDRVRRRDHDPGRYTSERLKKQQRWKTAFIFRVSKVYIKMITVVVKSQLYSTYCPLIMA